MYLRIILPLSLVSFLALTGCAPKATSQSDMDTPENQYRLGVRNLDSGDYQTAARAFQRAVDLDRKFALGWSGLGLTQAHLGNFEEGERSVDKGISLAGKDPMAHIYRARFWIVNRKAKGWFDRAEKALERALKLDAGNEAAEFYLGEAHFFAMNFGQAGKQFGKVVALDGDYSGRADKRWALAQEVVRANPGTDAGRKIALKSEISKADLAVLFAEELKATEIIKKFTSSTGQAAYQPPGTPDPGKRMTIPPDVAGTWAESWVTEILDLGLLEVDPSGKFLPDKPITRSEFATAVVRLLSAVTRDATLDTKYMGESPSRFSDVPGSHFAYSAMAICVERGFMMVEGGIMSTRFNPTGEVSGAKALLTIREFRNSLKMPF